MEHNTRPLLRNYVLVVLGALFVTAVTLYGLLSAPGELIREDVHLGPIIAASRIFVPLFAVIGGIYFLGNIKKCDSCGKIFFWRKKAS